MKSQHQIELRDRKGMILDSQKPKPTPRRDRVTSMSSRKPATFTKPDTDVFKFDDDFDEPKPVAPKGRKRRKEESKPKVNNRDQKIPIIGQPTSLWSMKLFSDLLGIIETGREIIRPGSEYQSCSSVLELRKYLVLEIDNDTKDLPKADILLDDDKDSAFLQGSMDTQNDDEILNRLKYVTCSELLYLHFINPFWNTRREKRRHDAISHYV
jgi:hypothetical protein